MNPLSSDAPIHLTLIEAGVFSVRDDKNNQLRLETGFTLTNLFFAPSSTLGFATSDRQWKCAAAKLRGVDSPG
jgi:hypothetical protein